MKPLLLQLWSYLRAVSGDSAYETYTRHLAGSNTPPPSRQAFYLETLQRRYSNPNRCC
jgi:uncharacterized short protein YbdD (DUF466 family)